MIRGRQLLADHNRQDRLCGMLRCFGIRKIYPLVVRIKGRPVIGIKVKPCHLSRMPLARSSSSSSLKSASLVVVLQMQIVRIKISALAQTFPIQNTDQIRAYFYQPFPLKLSQFLVGVNGR